MIKDFEFKGCFRITNLRLHCFEYEEVVCIVNLSEVVVIDAGCEIKLFSTEVDNDDLIEIVSLGSEIF